MNGIKQKEISFPVTLRCKPVDFWSIDQMREIALELYPDDNKRIMEFLDKLEEK